MFGNPKVQLPGTVYGKVKHNMWCFARFAAICVILKKKFKKKTYKTQENKFPIFFFKIATESGMPFFPKIAFWHISNLKILY